MPLRRMSQATQSSPRRLGHADLNLLSRDAKARKIEALLDLRSGDEPLRILEVGTGSGGIAHYFGSHPYLSAQVESVDVSDTRQIRDGYRFTQVAGTHLPFADASFDVVISNHVIEHVGDQAAQGQHLAELRRVLCQGGIGYLAVPNRWQVVEPHYRLPFLSWLPQRIADAYVQAAGKGGYYDCRPLTTREVERRIGEAGFSFIQRHGDALRLTYELEQPDAPLYHWLFKRIPDVVYKRLRRAFPTLIYVLAKTHEPRKVR